MHIRGIFASIAPLALALCTPASADTIPFSTLSLNGKIATGKTSEGVAFTITGPANWQLLKQPSTFAGAFPSGAAVLFTSGKGSATITFASPISFITGFGIQDNGPGPFTGSLKAFDINNNLLGSVSYAASTGPTAGELPGFDFSAPGIVKLIVGSSNPNLGYALGHTAVVPEMNSWMLMMVGIGFVGATLRSRHKASVRLVAA
jgi:hypothetical protein